MRLGLGYASQMAIYLNLPRYNNVGLMLACKLPLVLY